MHAYFIHSFYVVFVAFSLFLFVPIFGDFFVYGCLPSPVCCVKLSLCPTREVFLILSTLLPKEKRTPQMNKVYTHIYLYADFFALS
ncbi:hypothetical protein CSUI_010257 [Cystoisospora suis]|uniref:Transmembrane protein n=1 Tax=Cystoisospora suis TaxID=483139 RepID=A0A2C6KHC9_9APIC|nr:hypothetical protein CSUI_010257 [Cystoisospora suis]